MTGIISWVPAVVGKGIVMKKAIITGPTGAVGVSLIQELIQKGWMVAAVARPGSKRLSAIPKNSNVMVVECDAQNLRNLPTVLNGTYDVFYHFAWNGTYGESRMNIMQQNENVKYTLDAVNAAYELGCGVFVGAGSQSEFGHVSCILSPDMPCKPDNGYGAAKLAACNLSRVLCTQLGIRHEWCRILSLYGPYDAPYTMVMSLIHNLLSGKRPVCTKGDQLWDYIYNKDAARAFRLVAEKGVDGSIYCFGSGKPRLLKEYITAIRDAVDPAAEIGFGELPYYPNQVMHLEADLTNLYHDTGFRPQYSFEEGIQETITWVKQNKATGMEN